MEDGNSGGGRGASALRLMAYGIIVVAGLRAAAPVILPVLAAALLSVACLPLTRRLMRFGLPRWLSITLVMTGLSITLVLISGLVAGSLRGFIASLGAYQVRFASWAANLHGWLVGLGLPLDDDWMRAEDSGARVVAAMRDTAEGLLSLFSQTFLVLLVMVFMLVEAHVFGAKVQFAYGDTRGVDLVIAQVYRYLGIKALMSLLTGVLVGLLDFAFGIRFAVLWGLLAFLFNFVPNIGSIVAALPAIALTLLEHGPARAAVLTIGYLIINLGISDGLEPRVMGEQLGLSPLVVIISVLFWAWVWGPFGMILALPMTMVVKIFLESSDDLRPIAVLLGPGPPRQAS